MLNQRLLSDVLWIAYGTIMMLAVAVLFSSGHWDVIIPLVLLTILFMGLFVLFKRNANHLSFGLLFGVFIIIAVFFYFFIHMSFLVLVIAGIFYYMMISWWDEKKDPELMWKTFFGFLVFCILVIVLLLSYFPSVHSPYGYLVFLAMAFILMNIILAIEMKQENSMRSTSLFMAGFFVCFIVVGGMIWLFRPLLQWLFLKVFYGLAFAVITVVSKVFYFLIPEDATVAKQDKLGAVFHVSEQKHSKDIVHKVYEAPSYLPWIGLFFLAVLAVGLFLFFRKKRLNSQEQAKLGESRHTQVKLQPIRSERKRIFQAPEHPIRKELFQLQKWAAKHQAGRMFHEPLGEWLASKKISPKNIQTIQQGYEKVRYGGMSLPSSEAALYHQAISEVKQELKQQLKEEKMKSKKQP